MRQAARSGDRRPRRPARARGTWRPDPFDQVVVRAASVSASSASGPQRRSRRERTRDVLEPGHPPRAALVVPARAAASGCRAGPRAHRPRPDRPTCARSRPATSTRTEPAVDRRPGRRRRCSGTPRVGAGGRHVCLPAGRCRPRGWLPAGRPARCRRTSMPAKTSGSTRPVRSTGTWSTSPPPPLVRGRGMQHARVLDGGHHQPVPDPPAGECRAQHGEMHGLGTGGRERHLVRAGADQRRDDLASVVEQQSGSARAAVEAGRVGPSIVERGEQHLTRGRVQRLGGRGVEDTRPRHAR